MSIKILSEVVDYRAVNLSNKTVFKFLESGIHEGNALNFYELQQSAKATAAVLKAYAKPNDRIILLYPPSLELIYSFFACSYAGMTAIPTAPPLTLKLISKLKLIIENANPQVILTTNTIVNFIRQALDINKADKLKNFYLSLDLPENNSANQLGTLVFGDKQAVLITTDNLQLTLAKEFRDVDVNPKQLAFLQYTSGSTSEPKGVMISHENILHNMKMICEILELNEQTIGVNWLPPYHDMGLIGTILSAVYGGATSILMHPLSFLQYPNRWLQAISNYRANMTAAPNFAYELCVNKIKNPDTLNLDLSCWSKTLVGAEPIHASTLRKFSSTFGKYGFNDKNFVPCYGLAEATLFVTGHPQGDFEVLNIDKSALRDHRMNISSDNRTLTQELVSCGNLNDETTVIIVQPDTNTPCESNQIGEIWIKGKSIAQGYWQMEQSTADTFLAYLPDGQGPFLRSGDLGFIAANKLYITGRIKDLIIIRGKNYYPHDIEATVLDTKQAFYTENVVAFSIEENNEEKLVVVLEVKHDYLKLQHSDALTNINKAILREHNLIAHKIVLVPMHTVQRTTSGKLRRKLMQQLYLTKQLDIVNEWSPQEYLQEDSAKIFIPHNSFDISTDNTDLESIITKLVIKKLNLPNNVILNKNESFLELGMDSLMVANLFQQIESIATDIKISFEKITQHSSISDVVTYLNKFNITQAQLLEFTKLITTANKINVNSETIHSQKDFKDFAKFTSFPDYQDLQNSFTRLQALNARSLYFNASQSVSSNKLLIEGQEYINFSSYNYLNMSGDPIVTQAAIEAIKKYGTSASASRLVAGEKLIHRELEQAIAKLIGTEDCITFTAGHATNVGTISFLFGANDLIIYDSIIHNSSLQGAMASHATRMTFPHNDYQALEKILHEYREHYERVLILTEGIFSMDGDIPDIPKFIDIKKRFNAFLMIDEAHSIGVLGKTGAGISEYFNFNVQDVDIWMGTLSKAFGSCGGYIAGSYELIEYMKFKCGSFVFSAGMSPANAAAALASIKLMQQQPVRIQTLHQRAQLMLNLLRKANINTGMSNNSPIIPIIIGNTEKAIKMSFVLKEKRIYALPIFYPAVELGQERIRLFITCAHTEEEIYYASETIAKACA